ncbi:MAG: polysaccharide biosynthesis tyrosine autokinase [Cyanobacteria bacterium]|nr:polysaccharide biosynthesis tyrosine autokinase [Cyanobacteriota bacterium]
MEPKNAAGVVDLEKYALILRRRWYVVAIVFLGIAGLANRQLNKQVPLYEASGKILVQSGRLASLTGVGQSVSEVRSLTMDNNPRSTQAEILQSWPIVQTAIEKLDLRDDDGNPADPVSVRGGLAIEEIMATDVLRVSYRDPDPKRAKEIANAIMEAYIVNNIASNRAEVTAARKFIAQQVPKAKTELDRAAELLRQFKDRNRVFDLGVESRAVVENMGVVDLQLGQARAQRMEVAAQLQELRRQVGIPVDRAVILGELSQDQGIQTILNDLERVQGQLATLGTRYGDRHPQMVRLRRDEAALTAVLAEKLPASLGNADNVSLREMRLAEFGLQTVQKLVELEAQDVGLARREMAFQQLRESYERRGDVLPQLEKRQLELERDLNVAKETYETLQRRFQESTVAENQNVGNARVIEPAREPEFALATKKKMYFAIAVFAGASLGVAAAFAVDMLDGRVRTVLEARRLLPDPLLAMIPRHRRRDVNRNSSQGVTLPQAVLAGQASEDLLTAYQLLQANLRFASTDRPLRAIAISSAAGQEGKSEVTAILAALMAQSGRRVLVIDANFRQPSQHWFWQLDNQIGAIDVLSDGVPLEAALQSPATDLDVLTAGELAVNPMALIDSDAMRSLLDEVIRRYDMVLIDTPGLGMFPDAAVLGRLVDGLVLVFWPKRLNRRAWAAAQVVLERSNPRLLGMIANGVRSRREPGSQVYQERRRSPLPLTPRAATVPPRSPEPQPDLVPLGWGQRLKGVVHRLGASHGEFPQSEALPESRVAEVLPDQVSVPRPGDRTP